MTLSSGEKLENPRFYETSEQRLASAQRGGNKKLVAKLHRKIVNQRRDWQHKVSLKLVQENHVIAWSNDNFKNMAKLFGKSTNSLANENLAIYLDYKNKRRKGALAVFIRVSNRTSTKSCSSCGALSGPTGLHDLKVRNWSCTACEAEHDRDINAAINTLVSGRGTATNAAVRPHLKS